jgi:cytochrome oxidase Cu insertion factor (SCO1/SenC/PrrC family)
VILPRLVVLLMAMGIAIGNARAQTADEIKVVLPEGWFELQDADAKPVRSADFTGKWLLIYFGYSHCVDLCPTGLTLLTDAMEQLGPAAVHVQPLFITVDPEHDRGPMLREFTAAFDKRLLGLTGTDAQIRAAAEPLGVKFQKVALTSGDYVVDHSSSLSLVDVSKRTGVTFRMAEPHLVAAKVFAALERAGIKLDNVPNLRAYR